MKHTRYCFILRKFRRSGFICVQGLCKLWFYPHRLIYINIKELELYSDWALRTWYVCWECRQHILGLFVWPIGVLVKLSGSSSFLSTNPTSVVFVLLWPVRKIWRDSPRTFYDFDWKIMVWISIFVFELYILILWQSIVKLLVVQTISNIAWWWYHSLGLAVLWYHSDVGYLGLSMGWSNLT